MLTAKDENLKREKEGIRKERKRGDGGEEKGEKEGRGRCHGPTSVGELRRIWGVAENQPASSLPRGDSGACSLEGVIRLAWDSVQIC